MNKIRWTEKSLLQKINKIKRKLKNQEEELPGKSGVPTGIPRPQGTLETGLCSVEGGKILEGNCVRELDLGGAPFWEEIM